MAPHKITLRSKYQDSSYQDNFPHEREFATGVRSLTLRSFNRPGPSHEGGPTSRSRRGAALSSSASPIPEPSKRSIRLTVKAPPSKLRQVMDADPPRKRTSLARSSKNKKPVYTDDGLDDDQSNDAEEDDEDEENGEDDDDDAEEDDEEEESALPSAEENSSDPSEEQDDDEEMNDIAEDDDTPMPDAPTAAQGQTIRLKTQARNSSAAQRRKPSPPGMLARQGKLKSVEEKEMEMSTQDNTEDEELSEIQSQQADEGDEADEEEEDEDEEEGEEEEEEDEGEEEEDDEEEDEEGSEDGQTLQNDALDTIRASAIGEEELSDSEVDTSRAGTPDPSKLTRRQRGADDSALMALSNEAQKKKFFTAEQITMRKAEMARRRKDLSEKRNEEEKADTLNRLLHKQAPKRRTRAQIMADAEREEFGTPAAEEGEVIKAKPLFVRTIHAANGTRVGVPEEWLGKPIGQVFDNSVSAQQDLKPQSGSRMVQVMD